MAKTTKIESRPDTSADDDTSKVSAPYKPVANSEWRSRVEDYTEFNGAESQRKLNIVRDIAYGMALKGGSDRDIAEYLGVDPKSVAALVSDITKMARAELRLQLKADQIEAALTSKLPLMKIWAGKQFAEQRDEATIAASEGEGAMGGLMITRVQAQRDPSTGKTTGEPSQTVVQGPSDSE